MTKQQFYVYVIRDSLRTSSAFSDFPVKTEGFWIFADKILEKEYELGEQLPFEEIILDAAVEGFNIPLKQQFDHKGYFYQILGYVAYHFREHASQKMFFSFLNDPRNTFNYDVSNKDEAAIFVMTYRDLLTRDHHFAEEFGAWCISHIFDQMESSEKFNMITLMNTFSARFKC